MATAVLVHVGLLWPSLWGAPAQHQQEALPALPTKVHQGLGGSAGPCLITKWASRWVLAQVWAWTGRARHAVEVQ